MRGIGKTRGASVGLTIRTVSIYIQTIIQNGKIRHSIHSGIQCIRQASFDFNNLAAGIANQVMMVEWVQFITLASIAPIELLHIRQGTEQFLGPVDSSQADFRILLMDNFIDIFGTKMVACIIVERVKNKLLCRVNLYLPSSFSRNSEVFTSKPSFLQIGFG